MSKSKRKQHKFSFICPLFEVKVWLYLGDIKNFSRLKKYYNSDISCGDVYRMTNGIVTEFAVHIQREDDLYTMIHETLHLVKSIFKYVGIPFSSTNDEIIAYYQNYWIRKFWNKMSANINEVKRGKNDTDK